MTDLELCKQKLTLLMAEIGAAQETYKEELKVCGVQYPLNQAVFCMANALAAIRRMEQGIVHAPKVQHVTLPTEEPTPTIEIISAAVDLMDDDDDE